MLHHLKGSKYNNADENVRQETKRGSNTNSIAETKFGLLDCLIMAKPNFHMINHVLRFIFFLLIFYWFLFQVPKRKKMLFKILKKNRNKNLGSTTVLITKNNNKKRYK